MLVTTAIIVALLVLLFATASFWINWWWFGSVGYRSILVRRYIGEASVFLIAALLTATVFAANVIIALRRSRRATAKGGKLTAVTDRIVLVLATAGGAAITILIGLAAAAKWESWLLWWHREPYGLEDPVFHKDISFYLFTLPVLRQSVDLLLLLVLATIAAVVVVYTLRLGIDLRQIRAVPQMLRVHVLTLAGIMLVVLAVRHYLANFQLAYSTRGVAFGAAYTDVHVQRPANWALAIAALLIGALLIANAFVRRVRILVGSIALYAVLFVVLGLFLPALIQKTVVEPSELKRENDYIANNIAMTRDAFGLSSVESRDLSGQSPVTASDVSANPATISNIRLWDYRVIRGTYQQLQSFVPYYVFLDVDVDRYLQDGITEQVVLSAREIDQNGLPTNAQTWTNKRLVYTHGYGAVASLVGDVSGQGLPTFQVERIPPTGQGVYTIVRPEIYFGESDLGWVAVDTEQAEFSGLSDSSNPSATQSYAGAARGSIKLSNYVTKLLVAAELQDRNILLSGNLTPNSKILLHRNIVERVKKIAPFFDYDSDPYLVIADGRLVWMIDAYTTSDVYPHASRIDGVNYIRNSVKVTVDAYDGTVTFYRTATPDPIADAYGKMYPGLFQPITDATPTLAAHFRYPEHLFELQSEVFATVHVADASTFYNGEDRWDIPQEQVDGVNQRMVPYYVTMTLPGETTPEFALIRPFIPGGQTPRQNMTAWMAGRVRPDGTTSLVVYRFPRQETVFGPSQIEGRINQEPSISAQISLWNQSGSRVLRGNLLVIPIGESVLYVQPLYLQAADSATALPELKRVIVASNEGVVMAETLPAALAQLTNSDIGNIPSANGTSNGGVSSVGSGENSLSDPRVITLIQQAVDAYTRGQQALATGDWSAYGAAQGDLKLALDQLAALTGTTSGVVPAASPVATPVSQR